MKKMFVMFMLSLMLVTVFTFVTNAGTWTIVTTNTASTYTAWTRVTTLYNYSNSSDSFSYNVSRTNSVTISAEVGLDKVVAAKIGFSAGHSVTKSITYNGSLPARTYRHIDTRWERKRTYGTANYKGDWWNPLDKDRTGVSYNSYVPRSLEIRASAAYSI